MMTLKHSTHQSTLGLIYSPEDSLASHTVSQEHSRTTMTVSSGQKCLESYKNVSPLGSLVRMCLESSTWHSTESSLIWKKKITKSSRLLFQLAPSMRRTSETGFGLWPTPNARDYKDSMGMNFVGGGADKGSDWIKYQGLCSGFLANSYGKRTQVQVARKQPTIQMSRSQSKDMDEGCIQDPVGVFRRIEPRICGVAYGIPNRVDRIKCLGNAIVPQVALELLRNIAKISKKETMITKFEQEAAK